MRKRIKKNGVTVNAIAGTYVVFLGLDITPANRRGFRGFAIKRLDHKDGEQVWLRGLKAFEALKPDTGPGETFSSFEHPIQGFQWSDYSAKAGYKYTYTICCMYGMPGQLEQRHEVEVTITTETELGAAHSVFFNRGSVATQEYARKFLNQKPKDVGDAAYIWLSRGLLESITGFIQRAGAGDSIHGAIYEFQWPVIHQELKAAKNRGVKVKIIYDSVAAGEGPRSENIKIIKKSEIIGLTIGRENAKLMHNKFMVLSTGNRNKAVLTGSTNQTENGIFGHSNLVHIVEDTVVADAYMEYWERLNDDPFIDKEYRTANMDASPVFDEVPQGTTPIFSPRATQLDSLNWYSGIAAKATDALLMTFAFGMHANFKTVYQSDDDVLRMALMEKVYASPSVKERDEEDILAIRNLPNVVVSVGNRIPTNAFDQWLKEIDRIIPRLHVYWVHTKYMIVDPLSNDPIVISGSANFSKASTDTNDENMLIIRGDKRIADIYFGEYMRLFNHYSFRESVKRALDSKSAGHAVEWRPQFLSVSDDWMEDYFNNTSDRSARNKRREYFAGNMSE